MPYRDCGCRLSLGTVKSKLRIPINRLRFLVQPVMFPYAMVKNSVIAVVTLSASLLLASPQVRNIYHSDWIDLNKNDRQDPYENRSVPIEQRIDDLLSQMNLEEKTAQMATLYGYGRVLKDELPTPEWKTAIWKDGIANIDEHLNGIVNANSD